MSDIDLPLKKASPNKFFNQIHTNYFMIEIF